MATISDVAKLSGLSKTTVSRVINNHPYVSKDKRAQVYEAMEQLGYSPNPAARRLRGQITTTIGVIVPKIVNPFFSHLVNAIEQTAYQKGYQVLIFQSYEDKNKEIAFLNLLKTRQVDGIILTSIENKWEVVADYQQYGPMILCNDYINQNTVPMIRLDQAKGAFLGIEHLIKQGHQKIAYCTGGLFDEEGKGKDRNNGFQKAMTQSGVNVNPQWIFIDQHSIEDGRDVLRQLLEMTNRPTAIFTGSDEVAAGVIMEAKKNGLTVPRDLAVVGFDDQPLAQIVEPNLTTIRQPVNLMGTKASERMIQMIEEPHFKPEHEQLPIELVVRSST
ncbi:LacI family DNA-binding transcriptional regulator [Shouchella sp. JSM 1781072]|uniref:LacI family DNA-binding transcriptional regulator n=1 Tax=Shouchella sp. JSM 1781072 TaxID=3344581 RepID=UPI0035C1FFC9